jgi:hypothetical protein
MNLATARVARAGCGPGLNKAASSREEKNMSEKQALDTCQGLEISVACDLLQQQGFGLSERFEHIHATRDNQEWHVCLVRELASMHPSHFLLCLDEAIKHSLQGIV